MAKNKTDLMALIATNLPDNTSQFITPEKVREVLVQTADSMLYAAAGVKEVEVLRTNSNVTQQPSALNTALQVVFGVAQGGPSNPVMINAAGTVTFNVAGNYAVRIKLQCGRTASTGAATVGSRILLNGVAVGVPAAVRLDNASTIIPTESRVVINATAGQALQVQIMRDGSDSSVNAGGIFAATSAGGWGTYPSALLVISRLEPV